MCQYLPLGCLHCLLVCAVVNRNFGCSARFYIFTGTSSGSETFCTVFLYNCFIFLLERQTVLKLFAMSLYTNCLFFLILAEFLEYQRYGECSDYYRLSYLRQILFLMHSLLILMKLSISISGLSHEKVILK